MNQENSHCTNCLPAGDREGTLNQSMALLRFQVHSSLNRFPAMCQSPDGSFNVCHSKETSEQMPVLPH